MSGWPELQDPCSGSITILQTAPLPEQCILRVAPSLNACLTNPYGCLVAHMPESPLKHMPISPP